MGRITKFNGPFMAPSKRRNEWMNGLFSVTMCNIKIVCNQMTKKKKPYIQICTIYSLTTKWIQLCQAQNLLWVILRNYITFQSFFIVILNYFVLQYFFLETQLRSAQFQSITETISPFNSPQKTRQHLTLILNLLNSEKLYPLKIYIFALD